MLDWRATTLCRRIAFLSFERTERLSHIGWPQATTTTTTTSYSDPRTGFLRELPTKDEIGCSVVSKWLMKVAAVRY